LSSSVGSLASGAEPIASDDHFVPVEQVKQFESRLTQTRSITSVIYDRESGGAEHCQLGAVTLWHAALFDWLLEKFHQQA
jgi:hypothetical protein